MFVLCHSAQNNITSRVVLCKYHLITGNRDIMDESEGGDGYDGVKGAVQWWSKDNEVIFTYLNYIISFVTHLRL